jgi:hypothetical protein
LVFLQQALCFCYRYRSNELTLAYTPDWETLAEALTRLVAAGQTEADAKRDLCRAIADGAIPIELVLAEDAQRPETTVSAAGLEVPARILPTDIDWQLSRPMKPWPLAKQPLGEPMTLYTARVRDLLERTIETVMVRSSEVSRFLIDPPGKVTPTPAQDSGSPRRQSGSGAKTNGIRTAMAEKWSGAIPEGLTSKQRHSEIIEWFKKRKLSPPSSRTIERVIQKIRNKPPKTA